MYGYITFSQIFPRFPFSLITSSFFSILNEPQANSAMKDPPRRQSLRRKSLARVQTNYVLPASTPQPAGTPAIDIEQAPPKQTQQQQKRITKKQAEYIALALECNPDADLDEIAKIGAIPVNKVKSYVKSSYLGKKMKAGSKKETTEGGKSAMNDSGSASASTSERELNMVDDVDVALGAIERVRTEGLQADAKDDGQAGSAVDKRLAVHPTISSDSGTNLDKDDVMDPTLHGKTLPQAAVSVPTEKLSDGGIKRKRTETGGSSLSERECAGDCEGEAAATESGAIDKLPDEETPQKVNERGKENVSRLDVDHSGESIHSGLRQHLLAPSTDASNVRPVSALMATMSTSAYTTLASVTDLNTDGRSLYEPINATDSPYTTSALPKSETPVQQHKDLCASQANNVAPTSTTTSNPPNWFQTPPYQPTNLIPITAFPLHPYVIYPLDIYSLTIGEWHRRPIPPATLTAYICPVKHTLNVLFTDPIVTPATLRLVTPLSNIDKIRGNHDGILFHLKKGCSVASNRGANTYTNSAVIFEMEVDGRWAPCHDFTAGQQGQVTEWKCGGDWRLLRPQIWDVAALNEDWGRALRKRCELRIACGVV